MKFRLTLAFAALQAARRCAALHKTATQPRDRCHILTFYIGNLLIDKNTGVLISP